MVGLPRPIAHHSTLGTIGAAETQTDRRAIGVILLGKFFRAGNFDWWSLTPDWSVVDEQIRRLASPHIDSPSLIPDL
jgi:hypothetical protein